MSTTARATPVPMTFDAFLALLEERPDRERWELVEGLPVMNPTPVDVHQVIVANLVTILMRHAEDTGANWLPLPGHSVPIPGSPVINAPIPDVLVRGAVRGDAYTAEPLVVFEVLSKSNRRADRVWRAKCYEAVPSIAAYVTVSQTTPRCEIYDRPGAWRPRIVEGLGASIPLPSLGVDLPLARVYRHTPLVQPQSDASH